MIAQSIVCARGIASHIARVAARARLAAGARARLVARVRARLVARVAAPFATALAALLAACTVSSSPTGQVVVPAADPIKFREIAYPILLADCGFPACHGSTERFFSVFGPGRVRLSAETGPYDPPTPDELALTFTRARSMLVSPDGVARSPLLRKPLAIVAGGAGHEGEDPWGKNVYTTKSDPRFQALFFWATEQP